MNALHVYTLLHDACRMLDDAGDHAIAAHVGQGLAMIEEKYQIRADDIEDTASAQMPAPFADARREQGSWA